MTKLKRPTEHRQMKLIKNKDHHEVYMKQADDSVVHATLDLVVREEIEPITQLNLGRRLTSAKPELQIHFFLPACKMMQ